MVSEAKKPLDLANEKIQRKTAYLRNHDLGLKIISAVEKEGNSFTDAAKELVEVHGLQNSVGKPFSRSDTRKWYHYHKEVMESASNS